MRAPCGSATPSTRRALPGSARVTPPTAPLEPPPELDPNTPDLALSAELKSQLDKIGLLVERVGVMLFSGSAGDLNGLPVDNAVFLGGALADLLCGCVMEHVGGSWRMRSRKADVPWCKIDIDFTPLHGASHVVQRQRMVSGHDVTAAAGHFNGTIELWGDHRHRHTHIVVPATAGVFETRH